MLFNLFINSIFNTNYDDSHLVCFADDLTIVVKGKTIVDLNFKIDQQIKNIDDWATSNSFKINYKKTKIMYFKHQNNNSLDTDNHDMNLFKCASDQIEIVDSVKLLGIYIDKNLNFSDHVQFVLDTLNPLIGSIFRKNFLIPDVLKIKMYVNIIMSKINYASRIWYPNIRKIDIKKLKRLNKRALRLFDPFHKVNINQIKHRHKLWDISQYVKYYLLVNVKKQVLDSNSDYIDLLSTRNLDVLNFLVPSHCTSTFTKSPTYCSIIAFSKLPKIIRTKNVSLDKFKALVRNICSDSGYWN